MSKYSKMSDRRENDVENDDGMNGEEKKFNLY